MADIFISYASQDHPLAESLARKLADNDYSVWWDSELVGGTDFRDIIRQQLVSAKCAIVIWTVHSINSRWVRDEADDALCASKLIPVRMKDLNPDSIPLGFRGLHTIPVDDLQGLLRAITSRGVKPTNGKFQKNGTPQSKPLDDDLWKRFADNDPAALHFILSKFKEFHATDDKVGVIDFISGGIPYLPESRVVELYEGLPPDLQRRFFPRLPNALQKKIMDELLTEVKDSVADDFNFWYGLDMRAVHKLLKANDPKSINTV